MSIKNLALVGVSAMLSTCLPPVTECDNLKIVSPRSAVTSNAFVKIRIENCNNKEYGWQLILDNERILEQRSGRFPFDTIWNFKYEGTHTMILKSWDKAGNVHSDSITIQNI